MDNENHITRREALKKMGAVAVGAALGASGLNAFESLNVTENRKMKVLAINGSSRKDGNTADMLNLVLKELENKDMKQNISNWLVRLSIRVGHVLHVAGKRIAFSVTTVFKNFIEK